MTLSISGGFANGGVYISSSNAGPATGAGQGDLQTLPNQGLTELTSGLVHNQPKPDSGGSVQFRFGWQAPTTPGSTRFSVYALGGDGNGRSSGDQAIDGFFDWVYGCTGKSFFLDSDSDGVGRDNFPLLGCEDNPPANYAGVGGDCDDYRKTTFPGAPELCNQQDDDCDGQIDEDAIPVELWPDADGDGYYDARTEKVGVPKVGCVGLKGFAAEPGDCRPEDKTIHTNAEELCNSTDDDCDGDVDERVRPTCGEGWCRREAPGCDGQYCTPGQPVAEKCNFLDDDCDGLTDEDADLCPPGQTCAAGSCVDSASVALAGGSSGAPSSPTPGAGGSAKEPTRVSADTSPGCALSAPTGNGFAAVLAAVFLLSWLRRRRQA